MGIERYGFLILLLVPILLSFSITDDAFAVTVTIQNAVGSSVPGCENTNSCFIPSSVIIEEGDTVTWTNPDSAAHTVTSGTSEGGPDGAFDSSMLMSGTTYSVTFPYAGTYEYFCMVHPWMKGIVQVS